MRNYLCGSSSTYMVGSDSTHERREVFQQRVEAPTATCRCWCSADGTPPTPPPGQIRPTRRGNRCPVLYHIAHIRKRPFAPRPQAAG
jgi:hypothetical protein